MTTLKPTTAELAEIVKLHGAWARGDTAGGCADLSDADLSGADLSDANLRSADLRRAHLSDADLRRAHLSDADLSDANLSDADLRSADLRRADLWRANLSGADLRSANLRSANLRSTNLRRANLSGADLRSTNLSGADLSDASLSGADLSGADLSDANLSDADLMSADLRRANLRRANVENTRWPAFQIPQEGQLTVWKKLTSGYIAKLQVPAKAGRTASLVGRKCRAEYVKVLSIENTRGEPMTLGTAQHDDTSYEVGKVVRPDSFDASPLVECTHGIHFFLTREEAEAY